MLTQEQLNHFDTFGFIVWRQAFSPDEIAGIIAQFEEVLAEDRQGQDFAGDKRQGVHGFLELRDDLRKLLEDDRIYLSIEQLLGSGFVWIGSDGNLYVGDTRWHPDNSAAYRRVKVAFYLDPVGARTGCLRVIPGSHLPGMGDRLRDLWPIDESGERPFGVDGPGIPFFPLESLPGDVVFFNQRLLH
jgi:ectoine hydroxylase-related dioxygenase (phytanoyl-CoA dioxygenase family)